MVSKKPFTARTVWWPSPSTNMVNTFLAQEPWRCVIFSGLPVTATGFPALAHASCISYTWWLFFRHHRYFFLTSFICNTLQDVGHGKGKNYSLNFPLRDGIDDASYLSVFKPIIQHVMDWYQPSAVVLQVSFSSSAVAYTNTCFLGIFFFSFFPWCPVTHPLSLFFLVWCRLVIRGPTWVLQSVH